MSNEVLAVIPARLGSSRFPRKVLYPYRGQPLLYYVWKAALKARRVDRVLIATDSPEIAEIATDFGADVFISKRKHLSGTDRVAEAASKFTGSVVINIQGDNLGLQPAVLDHVLKSMAADKSIRFATVAGKITHDDDLFNPNVVKVAASDDSHALWFSRYPIPFLQHPEPGLRAAQYRFLRHVGIYFFRPEALRAYAQWRPSGLEKAESLEQLRILEHGGRIRLYLREVHMVSVDSPDDLGKLDTIKL
jgi:3-deoxy-manno-octulosonate cytidylyltransferase (CMP-KDO synthetase)